LGFLVQKETIWQPCLAHDWSARWHVGREESQNFEFNTKLWPLKIIKKCKFKFVFITGVALLGPIKQKFLHLSDVYEPVDNGVASQGSIL
jgi:hypothetical protein